MNDLHPRPPSGELTDLWELVDELADLSERLRRAADAAMTALCKEDGT